MRQDYGFVKNLENLNKKELVILRKVPKGSHTDIILKESLKDREYPKKKLVKQDKVWMINSFLDVNKNLKEKCDGVILRSEFLLLRYLGNEKIKKENIADYLIFLKNKLSKKLPQKVIYRFCDYNNKDFDFLDNNFKSRGSRRLIEDEVLFNLDLKVVEFLLDEGIDVDILIPYIIFSEDFVILKDMIKSRNNGLKVGMMVEVPSNILEIEKFSSSDFFVFGPGDILSNLYGGINRSNPEFNKIDEKIVIPLVSLSLKKINSMSVKKKIYLVKNLIGKFSDYSNIDFIDTYMPAQLLEGKNL